MKILVTGLNGTLAPQFARAAREAGHEVITWDRHAVPPEDRAAGDRFLATSGSHAIAHLGMGAEAWAAQLAAFADAHALPFVFTSTAMVFDHQPDGPHRVGDERTARDDYGRYKIRCEDAITAVNRDATIVRIGWQIHAEPDGSASGNNMLAALDAQQARDGFVAASRAWRPACSFMTDTAAALLELLESPAPGGLCHLDSNAEEAHPFPAIVAALATRFARGHWAIQEHADYVHDQRLLATNAGPRLPALSRRLAL